MTIKKSKTKAGRYFICSGRASKVCNTPMPTIYADEFEMLIEEKTAQMLSKLIIKPKAESLNNNEILKLKSDIMNIENSIDILVDRLTESDCTTAAYINQKIKKLDADKTELLQQISKLEQAESSLPNFTALNNVMSVWDKLSFDEKRDVIQLIVDKILVFPEKIEIVWKL